MPALSQLVNFGLRAWACWGFDPWVPRARCTLPNEGRFRFGRSRAVVNDLVSKPTDAILRLEAVSYVTGSSIFAFGRDKLLGGWAVVVGWWWWVGGGTGGVRLLRVYSPFKLTLICQRRVIFRASRARPLCSYRAILSESITPSHQPPPIPPPSPPKNPNADAPGAGFCALYVHPRFPSSP